MTQLDLLWEYQKLDQEIDKLETDFRQSEPRKKFAKVHNFLKEQQKLMQRMENEWQDKEKNYQDMVKILNVREAQLQKLKESFSGKKKQDINTLNQFKEQVQAILTDFVQCENQMMQIMEDMNKQQLRLKEMSEQNKDAKTDYPLLKQQYEKEEGQVLAQVKDINEKKNKIATTITLELMALYQKIKKTRPMPIVKVISGQCSGCRMELAALQLSRLKTTENHIECENCGRILYLTT